MDRENDQNYSSRAVFLNLENHQSKGMLYGIFSSAKAQYLKHCVGQKEEEDEPNVKEKQTPSINLYAAI